jgi:8-amino-7-oxononanoate synthase
VLDAAQALERHGFLVGAIRPPTVPRGQARLRITLSAAHGETDIDRLLDALAVLRPIPDPARKPARTGRHV